MSHHLVTALLFIVIAFQSHLFGEVDLTTLLTASTTSVDDDDIRIVSPSALSTGPNGEFVAVATLTGPGISPQDGNSRALIFKASGDDSAPEIIAREGEIMAGGTYSTATHATIDQNGYLAIVARIKDPDSAFLRLYDAILFGPPNDLKVVEYAGRLVREGEFQRAVFLFSTLRHSRSGSIAYVTGRNFERAIWVGSPPNVPVNPVLEVQKANPGLPDGYTFSAIDPDILMNDDGTLVFTGTLSIPADNLDEPPTRVDGLFTYDGFFVNIVLLQDDSIRDFSLRGHSLGKNGHLTFSAIQNGESSILYKAPNDDALFPVEIPDEVALRTGVSASGKVLVWAAEGIRVENPDSVWLWHPSLAPQLLVKEGVTQLSYRNGRVADFTLFTYAAIGPNDQVAITGRGQAGFSRIDGVWLSDGEGPLQWVREDSTIPTAEQDINGFWNGLGNGADGRESAFFDDGSLLVRANGSTYSARVVPSEDSLPAIDIKMLKLKLSSVSNLDEGLQIGGADLPLIPVTNPALLAGQPAVKEGMVADGVTPMTFHLSAQDFAGDPTQLAISIENMKGGEVRGGLESHLMTLQGGQWRPGIQSIGWMQDTKDQFLYLSAIASDDVTFDPDKAEITAELVISDKISNTEVGKQLFKIRKPPVTFIHGYNTRGDWGKSYFDSLGTSRARHSDDFLITIRYGQRRIGDAGGGFFQTLWGTADVEMNLENTVLPFSELVGLLDFELGVALDKLRPNWAFTRHDVVAHSQGGVLARLLCASTPNPVHLPRGFKDFTDFNRGRFHRVITIGSPHNGSHLVRYLIALSEKEDFDTYWDYIPAATAHVLISSGTLRDKFDPTGSQIQEINDPDPTLPWHINPDAKFHFVQTTINQGEPPNLDSAVTGNRILGLGGPLGQIVLPFGSDGVVDFDSMAARGPGQPRPTNAFRTAHTVEIAHAEPSLFSRDRSNVDAVGQVESFSVAEHVRRTLDQMPNGQNVSFDRFIKPTRHDTESMKQINLAARNESLVFTETGISTESQILQDNHEGESEQIFRLKAKPVAGHPIQGEITWTAEIYGTDGISDDHIQLKPIAGDSLSIDLTAPDFRTGDLLAYANYRSTSGSLVFLHPLLVVSKDPPGLAVDSVLLFPQDGIFRVDDPILSTIEVTYADGTKALRYPGSDSISVSNPDVLDITRPRTWKALAPGTSTVTASFSGKTATSTMTVVAPPEVATPALSFASWQRSIFTADQINDSLFAGSTADPDDDQIPNAVEFVLGRNPLRSDIIGAIEGKVTTLNEEPFPFVAMGIKENIKGVDIQVQRSDDLQIWEPLYQWTPGAAINSPLVIRQESVDGKVELEVRDSEPIGENRTSRHYRLAVEIVQ